MSQSNGKNGGEVTYEKVKQLFRNSKYTRSHSERPGEEIRDLEPSSQLPTQQDGGARGSGETESGWCCSGLLA